MMSPEEIEYKMREILDAYKEIHSELERAKQSLFDYPLQIDRTKYNWPHEEVTGSQLRALSKTSENYDLFEIIPGHNDLKVSDNHIIRIRPGLRFFTCKKRIG